MLEKVDILTSNNETLELPILNTSEGILVKGIDGLGPVPSTIVVSGYARRHGSQYQASRRESRNIIFRFGLDSRYGGSSVSEIRSRLNRFFMPDTHIKMTFHKSSGLVVEIEGLVEANETSIFSQSPEVMVSVVCFDPDFVDPVKVSRSGEAYPSRFEYPVHYTGSVSTGIELELWVNNSDQHTNRFDLFHQSPSGELRILTFNAELRGGDRVLVKTQPGEKSAILRRAGVERSILAGITPTSVWTAFDPGHNTISVTGTNQQSYYEYSYYNRYGSL